MPESRSTGYFLRSCKFLSESDRRFVMRARALEVEDEQGEYGEECDYGKEPLGSNRVNCDSKGVVNRVNIRPSAPLTDTYMINLSDFYWMQVPQAISSVLLQPINCNSTLFPQCKELASQMEKHPYK